MSAIYWIVGLICMSSGLGYIYDSTPFGFVIFGAGLMLGAFLDHFFS